MIVVGVASLGMITHREKRKEGKKIVLGGSAGHVDWLKNYDSKIRIESFLALC